MPKGIKGFQPGHTTSEEIRRKIGLANRGVWIKYLCHFCGAENEKPQSSYKREKRHFCNSQCYYKYQKYDMPIEEHNRYGTGHSQEEQNKRIKARSMVNHAIRDGKLERKPCEVETCVEWPEGHHDDYDKPLVVRWLCFKHHREWHKKQYEHNHLLKTDTNEAKTEV